jgi:hypothetical protein
LIFLLLRTTDMNNKMEFKSQQYIDAFQNTREGQM